MDDTQSFRRVAARLFEVGGNRPDLLLQQREVAHHDLPDDDRIDVSVSMRQQIPHVDDLTPPHLWVTVP